MGNGLPVNLTPAEAATFYSLIAQGLIGGIGTLILTQMIKEKRDVPTSSLVTWTVLLGVATAVSVISIAKASKSQSL